MYTHASLCAVFAGVLAAGMASQQDVFVESGPYSVRGQVIVTDSQFNGMLEVQLVRDMNREVARVYVHSLESFRIYGLDARTYFVVVDTPGFAKVRHRLDVDALHPDQSLTIFMEREKVRVRGPDFPLAEYEDNIVDVREFLSSELRKEFEEAIEDFSNGNYDAARLRFEQIIQLSSTSYDAHKYLGMAYQQLHRFRDAETEYEAASRIRPASIVPLLLLGDLYYLDATTDSHDGSMKRLLLARAVETLNKAIQIEPNRGLAHYILGLVYFQASFYEDAEDSLLRALQLEPELNRANLALANVYIRLNEWQNALSRIDMFVDLSEGPVSPDILEIRSEVEAEAKILGPAKVDLHQPLAR